MRRFNLFIFSFIALSGCKGASTPSQEPIKEVNIKVYAPYVSNNNMDQFFQNLNAYAESKKESSRYSFTFEPGTEEDSEVTYTVIYDIRSASNVKELPSSIKNELKEINYIQCVKDFINETDNAFNVIPFDIYYTLLKYDPSLYSKDELKSLESIDNALNKYPNSHIQVNNTYNFGFLINNEFININDSDKLQEDNQTPLWCLPQYENYFYEMRHTLMAFNNIDSRGTQRRVYSAGDIAIDFRREEDSGIEVTLLPTMNLYNKDLTPYSFSYLFGFYFKDNVNLDNNTYDALYHLFMNKDGDTSILTKESIIYDNYLNESQYDSLKDRINSDLYIVYGQLKEFRPIFLLLGCLYLGSPQYDSLSECYADNFVY